MRGWLAPGLLALAACAPSGPAAGEAARARSAEAAERSNRLLRAAGRARLATFGLEGAELDAARERAVEAYRAVHRLYPEPGEPAAEAAFRAGELLRAAGRADEAVAEFERAVELGRRGPFASRAVLEIGHSRRRAGALEEALARYEDLAADPAAEARWRERASWWCGRVQAERGLAAEARRVWERLARSTEDSLLAVRAFDAWAASLVADARLEAAAGVLELCRRTVRARADEDTELGERVRAALERMRTPDLLAEAVTRRARSRAGPPPSAMGDPRSRRPRIPPAPPF